jgi:hypothetical protein
MGNGIVDGTSKGIVDLCCVKLVIAHTQLIGADVHTIEAAKGVTYGVITAGAHIVNECTNGLAERRVEDVVKTTMQDLRTGRVVHCRPLLNPQHTHLSNLSTQCSGCPFEGRQRMRAT